MLKKAISTLIAVIYLLISGGIVFSMHYCGGEKTEINTLVNGPSDCCEGLPEKSDCCHDELVAFKLNSQHFFTQAPQPTEYFVDLNRDADLIHAGLLLQSPYQEFKNIDQESPPIQSNERYKLLNVFII